jgi:hypothetical protein
MNTTNNSGLSFEELESISGGAACGQAAASASQTDKLRAQALQGMCSSFKAGEPGLQACTQMVNDYFAGRPSTN